MKILLVEDHADTCDVITRMLRKSGCDADAVDTVAAALAACKARTFDLIICDIGLPDGDGWELMRILRQSCSTPGIALTGYGMQNDVERSTDSGYATHLTKPVSFDALMKAIEKVTGRGCS